MHMHCRSRGYRPTINQSIFSHRIPSSRYRTLTYALRESLILLWDRTSRESDSKGSSFANLNHFSYIFYLVRNSVHFIQVGSCFTSSFTSLSFLSLTHRWGQSLQIFSSAKVPLNNFSQTGSAPHPLSPLSIRSVN